MSFSGDVDREVAQWNAERATAQCRELFEKFGGKGHPPMTFADQAALLEDFLQGLVMQDGSVAAVIVRNFSDMQLSGLAVTAMRLRRMAPHEEQIKSLVTGK